MASSVGVDASALSQGLTAAQKFAIKNSLLKIKLSEKLADLRFWGKVNGAAADYFIAIATSVSSTISKRFYWSNDEGATFSQLATPDEFVNSKAARVKVPKAAGGFSGNPALKYKDPDAPPKVNEDGEVEEVDEDEEEEEEEEEQPAEDEVDEDGNPVVRKPPPRRLTELERLSYNVHQIESETGIVPRGAYYITATGAIVRNSAFDGLSVEESRKLDSYLLWRDAQQPATLASIRKMGVANHQDFLDTIVPKPSKVKSTWSLHISDSGLEVSLRSLLYPGFEFQLEAGSNSRFGGAYFGNGEKNADLLFML